MMVIKKDQLQWFTTFLRKHLVEVCCCMPNCQLANELHRHIIRKYKGRKDYSSIKDNIWGVDIADIESLSKYNRRIKYLLLAIDLFSKYEWVVS